MSSGLYNAVSGAVARMQALETITNNLSNSGTPAYKKDRNSFESLLQGAGRAASGEELNFTRLRGSFPDFSQGTLEATGKDLDFAISGEGFFKIQGEGGNFYTRLGGFRRGDDGALETRGGWKVLGDNGKPIILPQGAVNVDQEGEITVAGASAGRLPTYTVDDPAALSRSVDGLFALAPEGNARLMDRPSILQGRLEASNVNPLQEMTLMMDGLRAFEAYQKVIKTYAALGSKLDELGSVG